MSEPVIELVQKGGDPGKVVAVACGKCRSVRHTREIAAQCCEPYSCRHCGAETPRYWLICDTCRAKRDATKEREMFDKAKKVPIAEYDFSHVCRTPYGGDGEYMDVDHAIDEAEAGDLTYAWACVPQPWPRLDAVHVLEGPLEEYHEDAIDSLDVEGLQSQLDDWVEKQGESNCFMSDPSRVVILKPDAQ